MKKIKIKDKLYRLLVESNIHVRYHHQKYASDLKRSGKYNLVLSLLYLAKLTVLIRVMRLKKYKRQIGRPYCLGSESELSYKYTVEEYACKLMNYDVISLDVFDTLVFRPFQEPTDLFYIVGQKLEYMDFTNIRIQAEQKLRAEMRQKGQSDEINIYDIYGYLEKYCGVNAKSGVSAEYQTELDLVYPNPFMKQIYDILIMNGKKIVAVTDMYLTEEMIKDILNNCGYAGIYKIFVSNRYNCSKYDGKLFAKIKNTIGKRFKYIHIGDNWKSDFENPKKYKIDSMHYENVNHKGGYYRTYDMSAIVGSAYRGIVNAHLHKGLKKYAMAYEYGFICGGIFALGYCNFIHGYMKNNGIDKILFLSRDGEVLKKVYDKLYPGNNSEYVYWSRNAAAKLGYEKYRHDYFRRFIYHKINTGVTVKKVFAAMEIDSLLPQFEEEYKVVGNCKLDSPTAEKIIKYLSENWDKIRRIYYDESKAAKKYYEKVIDVSKRVCTVDIGWAGSGGVILAHLAKDVWNIDCDMFTLVAGTNTAHSYEPNISEEFMQSGKMAAYLYSQRHNRNLYCNHDPRVMHNVFFEMLLSSKSASLKGFKNTEANNEYDGCELVFAKETHYNDEIIDEIQRGIYDFIKIYCERFKKYGYMLDIPGSDAYAPFQHLTANNNLYFKKVFSNIYFDTGIGDENIKKIFN